MAYRATYKAEMEQCVWGFLPEATEDARRGISRNDVGTGASIMDLLRTTGQRQGAIRNALERLMEKRLAVRVWDGNARYGRWLYSRINGEMR